MDDYFMLRSHVPAFTRWDSGDHLPFTQCFESVRHAELLGYTYQEDDDEEDTDSGDLYVAGDLYQNDVVTPAVILVPGNRLKSRQRDADAKQAKTESRWEGHSDLINQPQRHVQPVRGVKPVEEDLYRISPELLHHKNVKKKRGFRFLATFCCLVPTCLM